MARKWPLFTKLRLAWSRSLTARPRICYKRLFGRAKLMRKRTYGILVLATCLILISVGCGSSPTTPPPPVVKEKILTTVQAKYLFSGGTASGTVTYEGLGNTITKNLGEQAELGEIAKGTTSPFTITINVNGALRRIFRQVNLGGTQTLSTDVAGSADLDASNLINYVLFDGKNRSWTPRTITAIFNPDPDGIRLPQGYVDEIKRAMTNIQSWSKKYGTDAYITSVTFDENGNKVQGIDPPEGEIWIFKETQFSGAMNGTLPRAGNKVTSGWIFINTSSASYIQTYNETFDAFIQGEQNVLGGYTQIPNWIAFMMNRPRDTNNYVLATDNESQDGIDTFSTLQTLSMSPAETNSKSTTTFGPSGPAGPSRTIGPTTPRTSRTSPPSGATGTTKGTDRKTQIRD
jgi:hypothetical protein